MRAALMAGRGRLRQRRGTTVALVLLVGLAGGVVIAAAAGVSRTSSTIDRFVAYSRPEDVYVEVDGSPHDTPEQLSAERRAIATLPQVADAARTPYVFLSPDEAGAQVGAINPFAPADAHAYRTVARPMLLHGRFPNLTDPSEAVVDDETARARNLHVGSTVPMWAYSAKQFTSAASNGFGSLPAPAGRAYAVHIVGIVRDLTTIDAPPVAVARNALYEGVGGMILTPAFLREYASDLGLHEEQVPGMEGLRIRLRHGLADLPAFEAGVRRVAGPGDGFIHKGSDIEDSASRARSAIHLEAMALLVFGALAGLAALLLVGQALARQVAADASDNSTLAALGMDRRALTVAPLARSAVVAGAGAAVAVLVAIALSPATPIGIARRAEIHPGVTVNVAVLGVGFIAVVMTVLLISLVPAWLRARPSPGAADPSPVRPGVLATVLGAAPPGPAAVAGVGLSFERGRGYASRAAVIGVTAAVSGMIAAVTFGASLGHLVDSPREQGWNWDVVVGNPNSQYDPRAPDALRDAMAAKLAANKYVGGYSGVALIEGMTVDGQPVEIAGVDAYKGDVFPRITDGRPPAALDEVVLGPRTLHRLHRRVGDDVVVRVDGHEATMHVVGSWLRPTAGNLSTTLPDGGGMTFAAARRLTTNAVILQFAVRYRKGVDAGAASASLRDDFGREVLAPYPGGDIGDLARVEFLPYALAGFLVVLAVAALALTLLTTTRRHRRELAVLKTLGFVRRQVSATVAWQATTLAAVAVVVGIPAGIAIGRWTWRLVAGNLGSPSPYLAPLVPVLVVVPVTFVAANLLACVPGWFAARVEPSRLLRTE